MSCLETFYKNYYLCDIEETVMIRQSTFHLSPKRRGCHLVTQEILEQLPKPLPQSGMLNLFVQHTSCALSINENFDPDVRTDMEAILNHMVKEREPYYEHTMEGPDDMPAHAKCRDYHQKRFNLSDFRINYTRQWSSDYHRTYNKRTICCQEHKRWNVVGHSHYYNNRHTYGFDQLSRSYISSTLTSTYLLPV